MQRRFTLAFTLALALPAMALAAAPAKMMKTAKGEILTNAAGMTLYTFAPDANGHSACNGKCAEFWPPLMAKAGAMASGSWSVITRKDGSKQWAYKGKPLYTFVRDKKAGDEMGDGFKGVWHVAKP